MKALTALFHFNYLDLKGIVGALPELLFLMFLEWGRLLFSFNSEKNSGLRSIFYSLKAYMNGHEACQSSSPVYITIRGGVMDGSNRVKNTMFGSSKKVLSDPFDGTNWRYLGFIINWLMLLTTWEMSVQVIHQVNTTSSLASCIVWDHTEDCHHLIDISHWALKEYTQEWSFCNRASAMRSWVYLCCWQRVLYQVCKLQDLGNTWVVLDLSYGRKHEGILLALVCYLG